MKQDFFIKIIDDWKAFWMNQTQNSEDDFQNYFNRAIGIDANMKYSLARRLEKAVNDKVDELLEAKNKEHAKDEG